MISKQVRAKRRSNATIYSNIRKISVELIDARNTRFYLISFPVSICASKHIEANQEDLMEAYRRMVRNIIKFNCVPLC